MVHLSSSFRLETDSSQPCFLLLTGIMTILFFFVFFCCCLCELFFLGGGGRGGGNSANIGVVVYTCLR